MTGRFQLALVAMLAMVGVGFAGCIEAPAFLSATQTEATALQNRAVADDAARAWHPEAALVMAFTVERPDADEEEDLHADPDVGNGRAVVWYYTYAAPPSNASAEGPAARMYKVYADGTLVEEPTEDAKDMKYADGLMPISGWTVDSDAAVRAARANETFERATQGENFTFAEGVSLDQEHGTAFFLVAASSTGAAMALVDAVNGTLLEVVPVDFAFAMPTWDWTGFGQQLVHIEEEGHLDAGEPVVEFPFRVPLDGQTASLSLEIDRDMPFDGLYWAVQDAEGEAVKSGHLGFPHYDRTSVDTEFELDAGAYTLVLRYTQQPPTLLLSGGVDYELTFVVGGWDSDFDFGW